MNMMGETARQMPHMMGNMMSSPVAGSAMMAAGGYAAGKGLLGVGSLLLRNPLMFLATGVAAGIAAGYMLHKYEKEITESLAKATGMGKDFMLHQKENLDDLVATAQSDAPSADPVTKA
jgi:NADH:ubiquinone oxidoreductase subunit 4 (subunit M)